MGTFLISGLDQRNLRGATSDSLVGKAVAPIQKTSGEEYFGVISHPFAIPTWRVDFSICTQTGGNTVVSGRTLWPHSAYRKDCPAWEDLGRQSPQLGIWKKTLALDCLA